MMQNHRQYTHIPIGGNYRRRYANMITEYANMIIQWYANMIIQWYANMNMTIMIITDYGLYRGPLGPLYSGTPLARCTSLEKS